MAIKIKQGNVLLPTGLRDSKKNKDECLKNLLVMCITHNRWTHVTFLLVSRNLVCNKTFFIK